MNFPPQLLDELARVYAYADALLAAPSGDNTDDERSENSDSPASEGGQNAQDPAG